VPGQCLAGCAGRILLAEFLRGEQGIPEEEKAERGPYKCL